MKKLFTSALIAGLVFSPVVYADAVKDAIQVQDAFSQVAEKAFPAVVVINVSKKVEESSNQMRQLPPGFEHFFGPRYRQKQPESGQEIRGNGSGFIINKDGYIVTNHHVVGDSDKITVTFKDKSEFEAKLIGSDPKTDLAVIKIESDDDLPFLNFADSENVKVGHWAIAVGAPFSMDYSMTVGVVSQKSRAGVGLNVYENYIQTDASINPGNSGGPLLDVYGNVIGVNDFIISPNSAMGQAGNIGLGFAIPSNMAAGIVKQLIDDGVVHRPWLGISMQNLNDNLKKYLGVKEGVLVREAFEGNPAAESGVQSGDVITKVGESKVTTSHELQFAILKYKPGDRIPVTLVREGEEMVIKVKAGAQKQNELAGADAHDMSTADNKMLSEFGIEISEEKDRIYITSVERGSSAAQSGLRRGMVIKAVNRKRVTTVKGVYKALTKDSDSVLLYVSDGRSNYFVVLSK